MLHSTQLQFKVMAPEAQQAALNRLALRGASVEEIVAYTGIPPTRAREMLAAASLSPSQSPGGTDASHWLGRASRCAAPLFTDANSH